MVATEGVEGVERWIERLDPRDRVAAQVGRRSRASEGLARAALVDASLIR